MIARWRAQLARARRMRAIRRALEHHADQLGDPYDDRLGIATTMRRPR